MRVLGHFLVALVLPLTKIRLVLARYVVFLLFAAVLVAPLMTVLDRALGHSTSLDHLDVTFVERVWTDLRDAEAGSFEDFARSGPWVALLSLLFGWTFLSAGTLWVLAAPGRRSSMGEFLRGMARFWRPFLRLIPFLVAGWLLIWLINRGLTWCVNLVLVDWMRRQATSAQLGWILHLKSLVCLVLVGWWAVVLGLARSRAVLDRDKLMTRCVWRAVWLSFRHPIQTTLLMVTGPALLAAVVALYALARDALPDGVLALGNNLELTRSTSYLILSQGCAFLMQGAAVVWAATFLRTYRDQCPAPVVTVKEPEPLGPPFTFVDSVAMVVPVLVLIAAAAPAAPRAPSATPTVALAGSARDGLLPAGPFPADYVIEATLTPETQQVRGRATIHFRNLQQNPVTELPFHLYPNAFSHSDSVWMREVERQRGRSPVRGMSADQAREDLGYCHVEAVRVDGTPITAAIDDTLMTVPLATPIPPGSSVEVTVEFATRLPRTIARMGRRGDHFDVMQWYPKLGVHGPDGWDCRPFHATTEFFADFGDYDVTLIVPERYVVGATGERVDHEGGEAEAPTGFQAHRYTAHAVHDFAWCADLHFREQTDTFSYGDHEVRIRYLYQPYAEAKVEDVLAATKKCLELYGKWFLPYPYPTLTIDGLPYGLGGGMEYPTLFTISQGFPNHLDTLATNTESPVGVTMHEFGHQYWYGILASDEVTEAWLDEGVNVYVTTRIQREFWDEQQGRPLQALEWQEVLRPFLNDGLHLDLGFGDYGLADLIGYHQSPFTRLRRGRDGGGTLLGFSWPVGRRPGFHLDREASRKSAYAAIAHQSRIRTPSYRMHPDAYGPTVYSKTALALATLENVFGWDAVREGLHLYVQRHKFGHPTGDDFLAALTEAMPPRIAEHWETLDRQDDPWPVEPFLEAFFERNDTVDFAVTRVQARDAGPPVGYLPPSAAGPAPSFREPPTDPAPRHRCRVLVENLGTARLPVEVRFDFEDGSRRWRVWDGRGGFRWFEMEAPAPLVSATADPSNRYLLDLNRNNNGRRVHRHGPAVRMHQGLSVFWAQAALAAMSLMGGP